ncbi:hypothetical protein XJ44_08945 [Thermosipho affectus]|uniref:TOTE conflict system primase domain-containing protein n=1 Tax=Thermosipho affectus TaxID=660294 RepID=A0ABX3IF16_9BACT|nr:CRISPR-associated primase-polymerase type A1 [Thermosipho affectus]ONN26436.1 hypothetical protein XJ44_08945 [Thermosipho affectus]
MNFKELALRAEENLEFEKALEYFEKAEEELSVEDGTLIRYGELLFDFQKYEIARKVFEKIVSKQPKKEYLLRLAEIYEEISMLDKALEIYEKLNITDRVKNIKEQYETTNPRRTILRKFLELFSGREDVFAVQLNDGTYRPIRRSINFNDVKKHISGKTTIGIYQLKKNDEIKFAVFDVDIKKSFLENNKNTYFEEAKTVTLKISSILSQYNIKNYIEFTGNRGYHVWFFFDEALSSYKVKVFMESILKNIHLEESIGIEVFPKQPTLNGGLGNLIKVPLGLHKKTYKKAVFVDQNFEVIKNQLDFLLKIEYNSKEHIESLFDEIITDSVQSYNFQKTTYKKRKNTSIKKELVKSLEKDNLSEFHKVISNCHVLYQIIQKIKRDAYVSEIEEEILIKSSIKAINGREQLIEILKNTINFDYDRFKKIEHQVGEIPISCNNIRNIIIKYNLSLSLDKCLCKFPGYNTPYSFVKDFDEIIEEFSVEEIVKKIIEKTSEKFELEREIKSLKKILLERMGENTKMTVGIWTIRKNGNDIEIII